MKQNFENLKKTTEVFVKNLNEFAQEVSNPLTIGLREDSKIISTNSEDFRKGIFKILIMGAFKTGKSTLLNSIIGTKLVATRAISCTAIITLIVYGEDNDKVTVYFKDKEPEVISKTDYLNKYRLELDDGEEIETTGMATRFKNVEFAVVNSQYELFKSGVRFIDSPGLEDRLSCNDTTNNFVPKANAIIYTLNALQLFTKHDKEYIIKNFRDKLNENVFFVVNNMNRLNTEDECSDVIAKTRSYLQRCFINPDGTINENLYNKRVFFINALKALDSKVKSEVELDSKYSSTDRNALYRDSGVKNLEEEMQEFVTTDSRLKSAVKSNLETLVSIYYKAKDKVALDFKALRLPLAELEKNKIESEKVLKKAREEFHKIDSSFILAKNSFFLKLTKSFNEMILDMEENWAALTEDLQDTIHTLDLVKLAGSAILSVGNKERQEEKTVQLLGPFIKSIQKVVENEIDLWGENKIPLLAKSDMEKLEKEINNSIKLTNLQIQLAGEIFSGESGVVETNAINKINYIQMGISILQGDPSLFIENVGAGGMPWGVFIKKTIMQIIAMFLITGLFTGGIAILAVAIWEIINVNKGAKDLNKKILLKVKETLFIELRKIDFSQFEDKIWGPIDIQRQDILKKVSDQIEEVINNQNEILKEHKSREFNIKDKEEKVAYSLELMKSNIANIYRQVYGVEIDEKIMQLLATK